VDSAFGWEERKVAHWLLLVASRSTGPGRAVAR
jgi:hypothetical protein